MIDYKNLTASQALVYFNPETSLRQVLMYGPARKWIDYNKEQLILLAKDIERGFGRKIEGKPKDEVIAEWNKVAEGLAMDETFYQEFFENKEHTFVKNPYLVLNDSSTAKKKMKPDEGDENEQREGSLMEESASTVKGRFLKGKVGNAITEANSANCGHKRKMRETMVTSTEMLKESTNNVDEESEKTTKTENRPDKCIPKST